MIDVGLGAAYEISGHVTAPGVSVSVAWRPLPGFELQAAGRGFFLEDAVATREGRIAYWCFCGGDVTELGQFAELTAGVFPARMEREGWTVAVGARVGGALVRKRQTFYFPDEFENDPERAEYDPLRPGWVVAAVAEASRGPVGARLSLERVAWIELDDGYRPQVLVPGLEGFLRW